MKADYKNWMPKGMVAGFVKIRQQAENWQIA